MGARRISCLALVLVAGCGSTAHTRPTTPAVTRSALLTAITATRAVPTAHENLTLALAGPSGNLHFTVDGVADFRATTGMTTVASSQGQREQAIFRQGTVWLTDNAPAFTNSLPTGQRWVRSTVAELESMGAFTPLGNSLAILDVLRGVTSLRATGPRTASFTFSLSQAMARTPAAQRAALAHAIHTTGSASVHEYGSVALDPSGRVRSLSVVISGVGGSTGLFLGYSISITAVGAPVSVTPPASSVPLSSVPRLAALLRGSATTGT
jgi:hypothetical protein